MHRTVSLGLLACCLMIMAACGKSTPPPPAAPTPPPTALAPDDDGAVTTDADERDDAAIEESVGLDDAGADADGSDERRGDVDALTEPPRAAPSPSDDPDAITLPNGVVVRPSAKAIEFPAVVCLDAGWLEQIVCGPSSREHESLMVSGVRPSDLHAALLAAGLEAGAPGRWEFADDAFTFVQPEGTAVDVFVRYLDADGATVEHAVGAWIMNTTTDETFPDVGWVFGGSQFEKTPEFLLDRFDGASEFYVADMSGSIIGLVTFGDEVIGFGDVIADEETVMAPAWAVNTEMIPPLDTPVLVVVRAR